VESVLKKKKEGYGGKDLQKRGFKPGTKERESDEILKIIGINADTNVRNYLQIF